MIQGDSRRAAEAYSAAPSHRFLTPRQWRNIYPYILVAPVVILVGLIVVYPVFNMLYLSTQEYLIMRPKEVHFIGLDNYLALFKDQEFVESLRVSVTWVLGSVIPQFLVGLGMALLLNENFAGRGAVRTVILLPWVVSGVITGIIWLWLFDGTIGVVNDLFSKAGFISQPVAWLVRPTTAFLVLFVANAWRGAPFFAINLLASMQAINPDLYEAAKIDGADRWHRFRYVTLPLIMGTIILSTLLRAIWTFNFIDLIYTITKGGPFSSTRTLAMYLFDTAYRDGNFGYAAMLAVVACVLLLFFSWMYNLLNRLIPET